MGDRCEKRYLRMYFVIQMVAQIEYFAMECKKFFPFNRKIFLVKERCYLFVIIMFV